MRYITNFFTPKEIARINIAASQISKPSYAQKKKIKKEKKENVVMIIAERKEHHKDTLGFNLRGTLAGKAETDEKNKQIWESWHQKTAYSREQWDQLNNYETKGYRGDYTLDAVGIWMNSFHKNL